MTLLQAVGRMLAVSHAAALMASSQADAPEVIPMAFEQSSVVALCAMHSLCDMIVQVSSCWQNSETMLLQSSMAGFVLVTD
jgi:hypothetical protein